MRRVPCRPGGRTGRGVRLTLAFTLLVASVLVVTGVTPGPARATAGVLAARPYLGWSSWSLQSTHYPGVNPRGNYSWLTEAHVLQQADVMAAKLKSHGYRYINIDAGWWMNWDWQPGYDAYGRQRPDPVRFPHGIAYVADRVHRMGLKLGIYLPVGLEKGAYNGGNTPIHGTTDCHTRDIVYPDLRTTNGWDSAYKINYANPCAQSYIDSLAQMFADWGVDLLKLDGVGPGSGRGGSHYDNTSDVAAWSTALARTGRPIRLQLSWSLSHNDVATWQRYATSWRIDTDVECYCDTLVTWDHSVKQRWNDVVQWIGDARPGGWNNLDSLDVGVGAMDGLTRAERRSSMTLWAIEAAPLYSGDDLTKLDSYGLSLLTNDEVIAVDQAGNPARPVSQASNQQVWYARNPDGSLTVALFNLDPNPAPVTAHWRDLGIAGKAGVRDLWSHTNLGNVSGAFRAILPAHGSRLLRLTPRGTGSRPATPLGVHPTGSTPSSVSLAWDPSTDRKHPTTGYTVYAGTTKVASTRDNSVTVPGLAPATTYRITVVARDAKGRHSPASSPATITTPASGGPTWYEAESPDNTTAGGARVASCSACSGGEKIGNLGGGGSVTVHDVTVPRAGTYLMTIAYTDGDSSRVAVLTVNGTSVEVTFPGTNDNNWNAVQTLTVPVPVRAGTNTIRIGNPDGWAPDIDRIAM